MTIIGVIRQDGKCGDSCIKSFIAFQENTMTLLLLEALGALLLLVFIVWWTMFSGRKKGELKDESAAQASDAEKNKK